MQMDRAVGAAPLDAVLAGDGQAPEQLVDVADRAPGDERQRAAETLCERGQQARDGFVDAHAGRIVREFGERAVDVEEQRAVERQRGRRRGTSFARHAFR